MLLLNKEDLGTKRAERSCWRAAQGLTYAQAGVSVDAGNALVKAIKLYVRSTRRPGADAEIGGFGGVFDLKAAGYTDPLLVSGTDGVGTKLHIAIDAGIHDTVGMQPHRTVYLCHLTYKNNTTNALCLACFYDRHRFGGHVR